jgi:tetratricopeptide (TPR) repeat protein
MAETHATDPRSPMAHLWLGMDQPEIGEAILLMRATFGLTRQQLIDYLSDVAPTVAAKSPDVSLVYRWEKGTLGKDRARPGTNRRLLLAKACEAEVVRLDAIGRRTFLKKLTALAGTPWLAAALDDLLQLGKSATFPAEEELLATWDSRKRVTVAVVDAVKELTRTFRRVDNQLGGGYAQALVSNHLQSNVMPMLRQGHYDESVGQQLRTAAAELAHLAGWMAYDVELHVTARQYLDQALLLSVGATDPTFGGEVLAGMSHQAIYLNRVTEAIDLAQAARQTATKAKVPALLAEAYVMEAQGYARRGEAKRTATFLHRAQLAFEQSNQSSGPEWMQYFDEAYLAAKFAHCFRDLGEWSQATTFARRSLNMDADFVRGKAFNTALLASTVINSDLREACALGYDALQLVSGLQSGRSLQYIRDLQHRLQDHHDEQVVRAFNDRVTEVLASVAL